MVGSTAGSLLHDLEDLEDSGDDQHDHGGNGRAHHRYGHMNRALPGIGAIHAHGFHHFFRNHFESRYEDGGQVAKLLPEIDERDRIRRQRRPADPLLGQVSRADGPQDAIDHADLRVENVHPDNAYDNRSDNGRREHQRLGRIGKCQFVVEQQRQQKRKHQEQHRRHHENDGSIGQRFPEDIIFDQPHVVVDSIETGLADT